MSFIGDYGQDAKKSFTQTTASNPNNSFSAYQNNNNNKSEKTNTPQVIFFNYSFI